MRAVAVIVTLLLLAPPANAAQRVYEGDEAAAIRCANMMVFTGVTLHQAGLMGDAEKDVLVAISVLILQRHVSGPWATKKRAMEAMRDRRDVEATLEDYQRNAPLCLKRFSIN